MKLFGDGLRSLAVARRFVPWLAEHRLRLAGVAGAGLAAAALEVLRPWPIQALFDYALVPSGEPPLPFGSVVALCVSASLLVIAARAAVEYWGALRQAEVAHDVTRSLRRHVFEQLTKLPLSFHAANKSGDMIVRLMGDVPMLRTMLVDSAVALLSRVMLVLATLGVMLAMDPLLTLVICAVIPVLFLVVRMISRRITSAVRKQRKKEGAMADWLHEAVAGVAVIQSLGRGPDAVRRFARSSRSEARAGLKAMRLAARLSFTVESLLAAAFAGTLGLGAWRVSQGRLSPGELLVFLSYVRGMLKPIRAVSRHAERIARGTACGERILSVLDASVDVSSPPGAPRAPEHPRELAYDGVGFRYGDGPLVLSDVNIVFRPGELTGLFGRSGAGKSTLTSLALRLADPSEGVLRLDGIDLTSLDLDSLRARFGLCLQETVLFGDSVRENLALGAPDASDDDLWRALAAVAADDVVRALPDGLEHVLGSIGTGLSGGQRRRLTLARTLLRDPPVLLVDEPFAGLDRPAARTVLATLKAHAEHAIVLVVCHELDHLEAFDRIVFLERGRVVGDDSHAHLQASCPAYAELVARTALDESEVLL
ncbi:MAG: hypothetical protein DRQ55_00655 [Planctomycetota bacterium]|nr:MAG: hypothetical protein DRQ55_00655 [Planctomycetota bacterium]